MQWSPLQALRLSSKICGGHFAHDGIPRGAEAFAVADDQIGGVVYIRAGINGIAVEHAGDADCCPEAGSTKPFEFLSQLLF